MHRILRSEHFSRHGQRPSLLARLNVAVSSHGGVSNSSESRYHSPPSPVSNLSMSGLPLSTQMTLNHRRSFSSNASSNTSESSSPKPNFWDSVIARHGPDQIRAPEGFNRWRMVPYAVSTHLCLGAIYAWSIFNEPLSRSLGVVCSSSEDWSLTAAMGAFTAVVVGQGLGMAGFGKWVDRVGPRISGFTGSVMYGGGTMIGGLGVAMHSLPLLYTGYGIIGGIGMGLAYLGPVSTLVKWFPDRRGLATGLAISGFGGGAIFAAQIKRSLLESMMRPPEFVGRMGEVKTSFDEVSGRLLWDSGDGSGVMKEVVNATQTQLASIPGSNGLSEGLYLVGSGDTGVAACMAVLGAGYLTTCVLGSMIVKLPPIGYTPAGMAAAEANESTNDNKEGENAAPPPASNVVHIDDVMKTPQFWLQWLTFLSTATVGMGIMSCAKDVVNSCFAANAAFSALYVQLLSFGNLSGRFVWSTSSDVIGRKNTFALFTLGGLPLCLALPMIVHSAADSVGESVGNMPLYTFVGSTMLIISFFGGGYSTVPAYEADVFGAKYIAAVHGRMMTASASSGISGPIIFGKLRESKENTTIQDMVQSIDADKFELTFGAGVEQLPTLIESKAVTIPKLMELMPDDYPDPSVFLYDTAFQTMGGVLAVGAVANLMVRPVNPKWLEVNRRQ